MKFIEIREGISVRKDEIVSVERQENGVSRITTENQSFESNFPYETILKILEMDGIEEKLVNRMNVVNDGTNLFSNQHWAG